MVELIHGSLDLLTGYILKATAINKVLSYQSIGVFIQASLPGSEGMGEIHVGFELFLQYFVTHKLFANICCYGKGLIQIKRKQRDRGFCDNFGLFAINLFNQGEFRDAIAIVTKAPLWFLPMTVSISQLKKETQIG